MKVYVETNITPRLEIFDSNQPPGKLASLLQYKIDVENDNGLILYSSGKVTQNLFNTYLVPAFVIVTVLSIAYIGVKKFL